MENFDFWGFIEKYLPDYSGNEDVALSNDIAKVLGERHECSEMELENVAQYADIDDEDALLRLQTEIDAELLKRAYINYCNSMSYEHS